MSRDDFEQRVYVAKINAGGSAGDAAVAAAEARDWWELTYRKPKGYRECWGIWRTGHGWCTGDNAFIPAPKDYGSRDGAEAACLREGDRPRRFWSAP